MDKGMLRVGNLKRMGISAQLCHDRGSSEHDYRQSFKGKKMVPV